MIQGHTVSPSFQSDFHISVDITVKNIKLCFMYGVGHTAQFFWQVTAHSHVNAFVDILAADTRISL